MNKLRQLLHHLNHDYAHTRETVVVVAPKCGPYDPRDDEARSSTMHKDICCTCGKIKLREAYYWI